MLNVVALQGRLVADPELRHTQSDIAVCSFRIAVDRNATGSDGQRQADFIDVVAWRGTAELVCKYFTKGQMIALNGSIQTRSYEDKNGNKRTAVEVVAASVSFCGEKRREEAPPPRQESTVPPNQFGKKEGLAQQMEFSPEPVGLGDDDDLPF